MAVHIYDPHALDLMSQIEGQQWKADQESAFDGQGFHAFRQAWELIPLEQKNAHPLQIIVLPNGVCSIAGARHKNRYTVRLSGEILFLGLQSLSAATSKLASALGFFVYPW